MNNKVILHPKYKEQIEATAKLKRDMETKRDEYGIAVEKYTAALATNTVKRQQGARHE